METIGRYYEDFEVGEVIKHPLSKTIFESDNNIFSLLTMNHHPVHINENYAKKQQHGKILVVGTLVFSLVVGMTVPEISGKAVANLEYKEVKHINPVFIGDTIYVETEVLNKVPSKSKVDRGVVTVKTTAYSQNKIPVLTLIRNVLIFKRG